MKYFLKNIALFFCFPILIAFPLYLTLNYMSNKLFINLKIDKNINSVFIGDSHMEQAIDDKLLHYHINLAKNSESFYFSYYKLKQLLESNPSIKNIYLGFSYHSVSSYYNKFIDGEFSNPVSSRYFYILPANEKINILIANRNSLFSYFKAIFKCGIKNVFFISSSFKGGFTNTFSNSLAVKNSMEKRIDFQFAQNSQMNNFSENNIAYLERIIILCQKSKINLTLINTPLHPYYKSKIPFVFVEKYKQIIAKHNLKVLDITDLFVADNCFIPDGDHVSQLGASLTTNYLAKLLEQ